MDDAMKGARVVGIFIAAEGRAPVQELRQVRAVPGRGLEGDRYFKLPESERGPDQDVTLITSEGLESARAEHGLDLEPGEHRRNIVTRGVDLLGLVGREISVGDVRVRVTDDNPPCRYLAQVTGKPVVKPLIRHGGIRGEILTEGTIRVGDTISS